jgi:hypothetical protein
LVASAACERFANMHQARVPESPGLYRQRFEQGTVVVNPGLKTPAALPLDREHYDPESGRWLRSVDLPPRSGRLLLPP